MIKNKLTLSALLLTAVALPVIAQVEDAAKRQLDASAQASAAPATQNVDPNKVVLSIGDQKMTAKEFDDFVKDLPPENQEMARGKARRVIADKLVELKVLAAEARARGLDKSPKFQRQQQLMIEQILASELAQDAQNNPKDDTALKAQYEQHKGEYETAKARHILIRVAGSPVPVAEGKKELTDAEAKAKAEGIHKRVTEGKEDFATVAKAESDDKGTALAGGSLGQPFGHGQMVPAFDAAAFAMKPGEISNPVKTTFGYHIIQLEEKHTPTFEEIKPELASKSGPEKMTKLVEELKKKYNPQVDDSFFGPPTSQPAMSIRSAPQG